MLAIPFRRVAINSRLSAKEICQRLSVASSTKQPFMKSLVGKYDFIGKVSTSGFKVTPVISGRNSYVPLLLGTIEETSGQTNIQLIQIIHPAAIFIFFIIFVVPQVISFREHGHIEIIWLAVSVIFHCIMYKTGFLPEAKKSEARLRELTS